MLDHHRWHRQSHIFDYDRIRACRDFLLLFLLFQCHYRSSTTVRAEANITVDDGDSRITYSPPGAWTKSAETQLDYGGSHMLTQNPNATAMFSFTGTAVYFLSPLWPYTVNAAISLDSSPASLIDLVDHNSKTDTSHGSETVPSGVVWSATRLSNTQHTLQISVGAGQPYSVVDALVYTDPSKSASAASPSGRVVADPSYVASSQPSPRKSTVSIALGVLFGLLGIAIILFALWYFRRRKNRTPASDQAWTTDGSAYPAGSNGAVVPSYGNGNGQGYPTPYGPPTAYGYGPQGQNAVVPYPPYAYGGYGAPFPPQGGPYPGVPPNRAPNRYEPGYTLSTITEKSTPQMADGTRTMPGTPMSGAAAAGGAALGAHSPASMQSELGYYTAPGSSVGQHSPAVVPGQTVGQQPEGQPQWQAHQQQQQQHWPMGITSQMKMQGSGTGYKK